MKQSIDVSTSSENQLHAASSCDLFVSYLKVGDAMGIRRRADAPFL